MNHSNKPTREQARKPLANVADPSHTTRDLTLFFSPEASVIPHLVGLCVAARTLKELGHKVMMVRCAGCLPRCPVKEMVRLPYDANESEHRDVCKDCAAHALDHFEAYNLDFLDLQSFRSPDLLDEVRSFMEAAPPDLRHLTYDGIHFGTLCMPEMSLQRKIYDFDSLESDDRNAWLQYIESSLLSYLLVNRILERFRVHRLVHYNDYPLMMGARLAADRHGVPVTCMSHASHLSVDRRRYVLHSELSYQAARRAEVDFDPLWKNLHLPAATVEATASDLLSRLGARGSHHRYSPPKTVGCDLHAQLGLDPGRKLLVAYTSSLDERAATFASLKAMNLSPYSGENPFSDQLSWLQKLMTRVTQSDDLQLVVRIHPREGATKRRSVPSQHLGELRKTFASCPPHCQVVWPEENISSYDLAEVADLVLTAWTTMSSELPRAGVPVLLAFRGSVPFPLSEFIEWAATEQGYFQKLGSLLSRPASLERIAQAFRWYNLAHLASSFLLDDLIPGPDHMNLPDFKLPREAGAIEDVLIGGLDAATLNREKLAASQHSDASLEQLAIKRQLRRIIHFVLTGEDVTDDYVLHIHSDPETNESPPPMAPGQRWIAIQGNRIRYSSGPDRDVSRYSPMVARLSPLCAHELESASQP